jgi:hypothetical protein
MSIQTELELATKKMIKEIDGFVYEKKEIKLAKLTENNVAIVEAMIRNDSAYIKSSDTKAEPRYKKNGDIIYGGSTAYWMSKLKKYLLSNNQDQNDYKEIIKNAVNAVDRENSTHINSDKYGRSEITERILKIDKNELVQSLKEPSYKNMLLFNEIARKTSAPTKARVNISFGSKFCHYACYYLFEGENAQDNYSIYDNIVRTVLPWYLTYYKIPLKNFNLEKYEEYRMAIDEIRYKSSNNPISRNGFDHLLWYFHKGRL